MLDRGQEECRRWLQHHLFKSGKHRDRPGEELDQLARETPIESEMCWVDDDNDNDKRRDDDDGNRGAQEFHGTKVFARGSLRLPLTLTPRYNPTPRTPTTGSAFC